MEGISNIQNLNSKRYLFYSMFDIDFFVRKNYTSQSQNDSQLIQSALATVNRVFSGALQISND